MLDLASRLRGRRWRALVSALAVLALVAAGAAASATTNTRFWEGSGATEPFPIDAGAAEKLVELTLTSDFSRWQEGDSVAIWRLPQPDGSVCIFTASASPKPTAPGSGGANPTGGGLCSRSGWVVDGQLEAGKTIAITYSAVQHAGGYSWLINGPVDPDSGVTRLELMSATGALPLAYDHGWFLAQLPTSGSANELPGGGPYVVTGYDDQRNEILQLDLQQAREQLRVPGGN